jgi:hypothetical protein
MIYKIRRIFYNQVYPVNPVNLFLEKTPNEQSDVRRPAQAHYPIVPCRDQAHRVDVQSRLHLLLLSAQRGIAAS